MFTSIVLFDAYGHKENGTFIQCKESLFCGMSDCALMLKLKCLKLKSVFGEGLRSAKILQTTFNLCVPQTVSWWFIAKQYGISGTFNTFEKKTRNVSVGTRMPRQGVMSVTQNDFGEMIYQ